MFTMELDPVDIRILELLIENGRLSYREMAKKVGVTTPTVSSKVEHLMDMGLIEGYTTVINPEMLDQMTILLTIECKPSDLQAVLDRLGAVEEVRELYAVDGTRVHAKVTVTDQAHLNSF
ncbi:MAG: Lrp/AsnC family transcriptional regulator, partial [Thermoplasmata archaeon]|nr:Lrp/AsnC family transcriptional regulator [Thermoplasmata archaeon]